MMKTVRMMRIEYHGPRHSLHSAQVRVPETVQAETRELFPVTDRCNDFDLEIRHSMLII